MTSLEQRRSTSSLRYRVGTHETDTPVIPAIRPGAHFSPRGPDCLTIRRGLYHDVTASEYRGTNRTRETCDDYAEAGGVLSKL